MLSDAPHVSQERICPALPGKLSVVVPAYNEAPEIEANLREMVATIDSFGLDYELIVVDDGSPDSTFASAVRAKIDYGTVPFSLRMLMFWVNEWHRESDWYTWTLEP